VTGGWVETTRKVARIDDALTDPLRFGSFEQSALHRPRRGHLLGRQITSSYIPANATSGTLFVSSGGTLVAAIKMAGSYSAGDFRITAGPFNTVLITDPASRQLECGRQFGRQ
jgi:hypothetical protein